MQISNKALIILAFAAVLYGAVSSPIYHAITIDDQSRRSVAAGITASTSQSQGNGALTYDINEVSTVGNANDVVTLPTAVSGREIVVINNGANTLQIFPASGDDLGFGANLSMTIETGGVVEYVTYDSTNWDTEVAAGTFHAEYNDESNTDAFVVSEQSNHTCYHTNGLSGGDLAGWAFDSGGAGTSHAITVVADSGATILVTTGTAHGLAIGDIVSQSNLTDGAYTGIFEVATVPLTTTYTLVQTITFTSTGTGTMDQCASLVAGAGVAGDYMLHWSASATTATNNEEFDFHIHIEEAQITGTQSHRKFGTAGDHGSVSGHSVVTIAASDKVSLIVINNDSAGNLTISNLTLTLHTL